MTTRDVRRGRALAFFLAFVAVDAAAVLVACSSSSSDVDQPDATTETGTTPDGGNNPDVSIVTTPDGGREAASCASPADDKCNIVAQNCPANQECVVGSKDKTECAPVAASEQLPIGRACCSNGQDNPCLPGLTCVGGDKCVDGGAKSGRCSPACCKGDDQSCGKSDPEGISGACKLTLGDGTNDLFNVCTYSAICEPFHVMPCTTTQTCIVEDKIGTASCVDLFGTGIGNRQPCHLANDCADGLICLGAADAGTCHYACLLPGATHPFDAGVEEGGAGFGGCPSNEKCNLRITDTPDWFAACSLDGG